MPFFLLPLMWMGINTAAEPLSAEMPVGARDVYMRVCEGSGLQGDWLPIIKEASLSPEVAFWLCAARAAAVGGQREDVVFDALSDQADWMGKPVLLKKLLTQADNTAFLRRYARKFPEWNQAIGEALITDLENDFNQEKLQKVADCLREHPDFWVEVGKLDRLWTEALEKMTTDPSVLIRSAGDVGISPGILWREIVQRDAFFSDQKAIEDYGVRDNLFYIFKQGDTALREEFRKAVAIRREEEGLHFLKSNMLIRALWNKHPEIFSDPFLTQLELLHDHFAKLDAAEFSEVFFNGNVLELSTLDFFKVHQERILEEFQSGNQNELWVPLLCKLVMETPVLEIETDLLQTAIKQALASETLSDRSRFHLSFCGLLIGMKEENLGAEVIRGLSKNEWESETGKRIVLLLNESHSLLLPGLLEAGDKVEKPGMILRAMLLIAPDHPDVTRLVMQQIYEGGDRKLACELTALLGFFERAPPLSRYPEGRIGQMAAVESLDAYVAFRRFLSSYDSADHEALLPKVLPHLHTYAALKPEVGMGFLFENSIKNQRAAVKPLLEMLDSIDVDQNTFACKTLSVFYAFTNAELMQIGEALQRFDGAPDRTPWLLNTLSRVGTQASCLEMSLQEQAWDRDNESRYDVLSCLATVSEDPKERDARLSGLWETFTSYQGRIRHDPARVVRAIGSVRNQEDRVCKMLRNVLVGRPGFKPGEDEFDSALTSLAKRTPTRELLLLYRELLREYIANPGRRKRVAFILKKFDAQFSDQLPMVSDEIESMPLRLRGSFVYRKLVETLQSGWKEPRPAPHSEGPVQLAVLGVGKADPLRELLIPFLETRLSSEKGVVVLERERLHPLMTEQTFLLTEESRLQRKQIAQAGRILGVDIFCLTEANPEGIRVQLVDAWQGLKLWDHSQAVSGAVEMDHLSIELVTRIQKFLAADDISPEENLLKLGVLDFRQQGDKKENVDALSLRNAFEQQLSFVPGVEVMERRQMQPLLVERMFSSGLPGSLESVMMLLDGSFQVDTEDPELFVVNIRARRNEKEIFSCQIRGSRNDLLELGSRMAAQVREKLDAVCGIERMWPELEAEMLLKQARIAREPELMLGAVAAAKALLPDDPRIHEAYLKEIQRQCWAIPLPFSRFPWYLEEKNRLFKRELAERKVGTASKRQYLSTHLHHVLTVWGHCENVPEDLRRKCTPVLLEMFNQYWGQLRKEQMTSRRWNRRESLRVVPELFHQIGVEDPEQYQQLYRDLVSVGDFGLLFDLTNALNWPRNLSSQHNLRKANVSTFGFGTVMMKLS